MTVPSDVRRWLLAAGLSIAVVGCGTPGAPDGAGGQPGESSGAGNGDGGSSGGGGGSGSGGSAAGPITATMESGTYGFVVGRCEIIDDVVYVEAVNAAGTGAGRGGFEATLPAWDREIAYAQRDGRVSLTNVGSGSGDNFELVASRGQVGTTWEWTVSGSDVDLVALMANRMTAVRSDGGEEFTEYREVTIDIQCANGAFGPSPDAERYAQQEFGLIGPAPTRVPGSVTVDLAGSTYEITYLTTCQFFQDQVTAEGVANGANIWMYSEGAGILLDFVIGDRRAEASGAELEGWGLPPDAQLQDDFLFEGSDTIRSWSGTVVSGDGAEAEATITVECTEGDAFDSAGTASVVLDGVTHDLDVVSTCSIEGSTIEFFGQSSASDVTIIVTSGGSEILLGDEDGRQSATRDVMFDVSGPLATWGGLLAGDRQATVNINCG